MGGILYAIYSLYKSSASGSQNPNQPNTSEEVFCTQDAKLCPDGSYVGRSGPHCEFALCPNEAVQDYWKTSTDSKLGVSFRYPKNPVDKYMSVVDWPPKVQILNQKFACTEAGQETSRGGQTSLVSVNGTSYCVTKIQEGAAGSIYMQYAYAFPAPFSKNDKTGIFTFTMRYPQCGNYNDPEKTECENVQASFNLDMLVDLMAGTLVMK